MRRITSPLSASNYANGNKLTQDEQWRRLERMVQTAKEAWR